jgi:AcrR family transcriptional regulator
MSQMELEQQILTKTRELFFKYGVKSITMDDIAANLGMSKKTIYAAFPDKKALLKQMVSDYLQLHQQSSQCEVADSTNAIERMLKAAAAGVQFMEKINPVFLYDMQKYFGDVWSVFETYRNTEIRKEVKSCLQQAQQEGLVREELELDLVVSMHMQHIDLMVEPGHFENLQMPRAEIIKTVLITFLNGICTPKGIKALQRILEKNDPFLPTN